MVLRIEHLIGTGQTGLFNGTCVQLTNGDQTLQHILFLFRIRLVYHTLIALTRGAGLVGVDTGNENQLICHLFLHLRQTRGIVQNGILTVCRARTDDEQFLAGFAGEHLLNLCVSGSLYSDQLFRQLELRFQFLWNGQFSNKFHIHILILPPYLWASGQRSHPYLFQYTLFFLKLQVNLTKKPLQNYFFTAKSAPALPYPARFPRLRCSPFRRVPPP